MLGLTPEERRLPEEGMGTDGNSSYAKNAGKHVERDQDAAAKEPGAGGPAASRKSAQALCAFRTS